MLDKQRVKTELPLLIMFHLPLYQGHYDYKIIDDSPKTLVKDFAPKPIQGVVVNKLLDGSLVIKTGERAFCLVEHTLLKNIPQIGDEVRFMPYTKRDFDGEFVIPKNTLLIEANGKFYQEKQMVDCSDKVYLPFSSYRSRLRELKNKLEELRASDETRRIAHMLVDAHAQNFSLEERYNHSFAKPFYKKKKPYIPPSISFDVSTTKFEGRVVLYYQEKEQRFAVQLIKENNIFLDLALSSPDLDSIGFILEQLIDDGSWKKIKIEVLNKKIPLC
ncbi:hypothetical protein [Zophobihabitans entericus]|uniref:Uncharacterized protein n=1 Tax=Zophobihabitans entericus TaxID=1635327 RepID=A0A6G9ID46_9GAMM|nr:hypothetical protein [Zophobihabitans entericus]QIQ22143.1 hypothetical protein IPMB12_10880 [Zophobihabitans entericus]